MRHTISVLVENKFGVLARISGLFSGRGYNIESLSVGETTDPAVSVMTIVTTGEDQVVEQITKQLHKLIDVIKVVDFMESPPKPLESRKLPSRTLRRLPSCIPTRCF